jgi:hypothetical protein
MAAKCLHIVNLASVRDLERTLGRPVDPLRFRANVYVEAVEPWVEAGWVGKALSIGGARLEVLDRTTRCAATNVDPRTGERDLAIPATLMRAYGHEEFGVYAKVTRGAVIGTGDPVGIAD